MESLLEKEKCMRRCGVLMPISSLPSRFGIGGFSKEAYDFVDFLAASGQSLWQILPLGPTGYGDSPYQSFSTFAGSPYYISLDALIEEGLLTEEECSSVDFGNDTKKVDYEKIYFTRFKLLRKAFERANVNENQEYKGRLCRYSLYDDVVEVLTNERLDMFNIYNNYIYYQVSSPTEPALKRMLLDGSSQETVAEGVFQNINITSQYVYFNAFGELTPVYKTSTFGPVNVTTFDAAMQAAAKENK